MLPGHQLKRPLFFTVLEIIPSNLHITILSKSAASINQQLNLNTGGSILSVDSGPADLIHHGFQTHGENPQKLLDVTRTFLRWPLEVSEMPLEEYF